MPCPPMLNDRASPPRNDGHPAHFEVTYLAWLQPGHAYTLLAREPHLQSRACTEASQMIALARNLRRSPIRTGSIRLIEGRVFAPQYCAQSISWNRDS